MAKNELGGGGVGGRRMELWWLKSQKEKKSKVDEKNFFLWQSIQISREKWNN